MNKTQTKVSMGEGKRKQSEPIAKRLNLSANDVIERLSKKAKSTNAEDSIDEQIRKLQQELEESSDSSDSEDELDEEATVSLSKYADERIPQLPRHCLPGTDAIHKPKPSLFLPPTLKKLPFCCRPCGFQGKDLDDFNKHRDSEAHKKTANAVLTTLHCKLCRKKFNSKVQYDEHKKGKWHLQRLARR